MRRLRIHRLLFDPPGTILSCVKGANMKSKTDLTLSELYALERAARSARAKEV